MKKQLSCWLYLTSNAIAYFQLKPILEKKIDGERNIATIDRITAKMHVIFFQLIWCKKEKLHSYVHGQETFLNFH